MTDSREQREAVSFAPCSVEPEYKLLKFKKTTHKDSIIGKIFELFSRFKRCEKSVDEKPGYGFLSTVESLKMFK